MYYVPPPEGDWEYEVDDYGVVYAEPHWPLVFRKAEDTPDEPTGVYRGAPEWACTLRLAPNTEYQSWGAQYVLLGETCREGKYGVQATLTLTIQSGKGAAGWCATVTTAHVSVPEGDWRRWKVEGETPEEVEAELQDKVRRLQAWYERAKREREAGLPLVTAHARYLQRAESEREGERSEV
jgi:hypothetical protein